MLLEGYNPVILGVIILGMALIWAGRRKRIPRAQRTTTTPKGRQWR